MSLPDAKVRKQHVQDVLDVNTAENAADRRHGAPKVLRGDLALVRVLQEPLEVLCAVLQALAVSLARDDGRIAATSR